MTAHADADGVVPDEGATGAGDPEASASATPRPSRRALFGAFGAGAAGLTAGAIGERCSPGADPAAAQRAADDPGSSPSGASTRPASSRRRRIGCTSRPSRWWTAPAETNSSRC
ncbi:hypothetical protein [Leucobacter soli]|uniref:hypothetical protein n=1 Tax=Leucobacter soli TaxID=2812850 RepID=UPI0036077818